VGLVFFTRPFLIFSTEKIRPLRGRKILKNIFHYFIDKRALIRYNSLWGLAVPILKEIYHECYNY